ncbi:hypothetical protein NPIL_477421 [Nephila pilipes]|uniref:Uncharacterized protein n=1 Tax=Nephila pilipes TaxID=299642 RepID=A0A8X6PU11_NEPPI|nr:hypothetical protein NPIL_477421 [Nephila pilipes]
MGHFHPCPHIATCQRRLISIPLHNASRNRDVGLLFVHSAFPDNLSFSWCQLAAFRAADPAPRSLGLSKRINRICLLGEELIFRHHLDVWFLMTL